MIIMEDSTAIIDLIKDTLMDPLGENTMSTSNTTSNTTLNNTTSIPGTSTTGDVLSANTITHWDPVTQSGNEHRTLLERIALDSMQGQTTLIGTPYTNDHNPFEAQRGDTQGIYTDAIDNAYLRRDRFGGGFVGGSVDRVNQDRIQELEEELERSKMLVAKLRSQIIQDQKETIDMQETLKSIENKLKLIMEA